jgi:hypothetical protein
MNRREQIIAKMAEAERKLSALRTELDTAASRLTTLREELASLVPEEDNVTLSSDFGSHVDSSASNEQKIALFRSLFRGRDDVFPVRWENPPNREIRLFTRLHKRMEGRDLPEEQDPGEEPQTHLCHLQSSGVPPGLR